VQVIETPSLAEGHFGQRRAVLKRPPNGRPVIAILTDILPPTNATIAAKLVKIIILRNKLVRTIGESRRFSISEISDSRFGSVMLKVALPAGFNLCRRD
jgi:hypothetical protein